MFNDIQKEIEAHVRAFQESDDDVVLSDRAVAFNKAQTTQIGGKASLESNAPKYVCVPGSEETLLHTSVIDLVRGKSSVYPTKTRYYIRHNNRYTAAKDTWCDSDKHLASIVSVAVAEDIISALSGVSAKIKSLERDMSHIIRERDNYKFTLDTLKRNGAID